MNITEERIKAILKTKETPTTPEEARKTQVELGIITPDGEITEKYKGIIERIGENKI